MTNKFVETTISRWFDGDLTDDLFLHFMRKEEESQRTKRNTPANGRDYPADERGNLADINEPGRQVRIEALRAAVRWMPVALADEPVVKEVLDIAKQFAAYIEKVGSK